MSANDFVDHTDYSHVTGFDFLELDEKEFITETDMQEGWATNSTLKNVYQHTFSEERKQVDEMIDRYFEEALNNEDTLNESEE